MRHSSTCRVDACVRSVFNKPSELCPAHYVQWRKGEPFTELRIKKKRVKYESDFCSFPECGRPHRAAGLCETHYKRRLEGKELLPIQPQGLPLDQRFWPRVNKNGPIPTVQAGLGQCWEWQGTMTGGYGQISFDGRQVRAHRVAYEMTTGPIPEGMEIDHICHNPACVRPEHLRLATRHQNAQYLAGAHRDSKSGVRGVVARGNRWDARIKHQGKTICLGTYPTLEEADAVARRERAKVFDFPEVH